VSELKPPAEDAVSRIDWRAVHHWTTSLDWFNAARSAFVESRLRHTASAERTVEPDVLDAAVEGRPRNVRGYRGMGYHHDAIDRAWNRTEVSVAFLAFDFRGVRVERNNFAAGVPEPTKYGIGRGVSGT